VSYKLFIDDERFPITDDWVIVRTSQEAIDYVQAHGIPREIAFDHDLAGEDKAIFFVNWLYEMMLDGHLDFPPNFTYSIHSQNPIGRANIMGKLDPLIIEMDRRRNSLD
jgi:hypothetical protein